MTTINIEHYKGMCSFSCSLYERDHCALGFEKFISPVCEPGPNCPSPGLYDLVPHGSEIVKPGHRQVSNSANRTLSRVLELTSNPARTTNMKG